MPNIQARNPIRLMIKTIIFDDLTLLQQQTRKAMQTMVRRTEKTRNNTSRKIYKDIQQNTTTDGRTDWILLRNKTIKDGDIAPWKDFKKEERKRNQIRPYFEMGRIVKRLHFLRRPFPKISPRIPQDFHKISTRFPQDF